jgi:hypothetical protein
MKMGGGAEKWRGVERDIDPGSNWPFIDAISEEKMKVGGGIE